MPATITDIHGHEVQVVTPGDVFNALRWWVSGFGLVVLIGAGTALLKANDMQHAIHDAASAVAAQDTAIGGHATARLQLQSLRQTLDQVQTNLNESKHLQEAIARAVGAKVAP